MLAGWNLRFGPSLRSLAGGRMRFGVLVRRDVRFGAWFVSRVGAGPSRLPALPEISAPNDQSLVAIQGIGGETLADFGGAIATFLAESVSKRRNIARQISHEGRRCVTLRRLSFRAVLAAHHLFARELIEKPFHLAPALAVYGDRLLIEFAGRFDPRRFQIPQQRMHFGLAGSHRFTGFRRLLTARFTPRQL